jgi:hypothetical protein
MDRNREEHRENVLNRHRLNGRHRRLLNGSQHFTLLDTYGSMTLPRHITLTLLLGWHASTVPGRRETGLALNLSKGHCLLPSWPVSTPGGLI